MEIQSNIDLSPKTKYKFKQPYMFTIEKINGYCQTSKKLPLKAVHIVKEEVMKFNGNSSLLRWINGKQVFTVTKWHHH